MKTLILKFVFFLSCTSSLFAINASPIPIDLEQPDGTKIRLQVRGDEHMHWFEDMQGYSVVRNGTQYVYGKLGADGRLEPTASRVGNSNPVALGLSKGVKPSREAIRSAQIQSMPPAQRAAATKGGSSYVDTPTTSVSASGTVKNLVVLCQFSDHNSTKIRTQAEIDKVMNAVGGDPSVAPTGSVRDYYAQASYGIVTLQSTVVAWVTLPYTEAYYANGNTGFDIYPYGGQAMAKDALDLVDPLVDFGQFDADHDGYIDSIDFIHSGYGAETGGGGGNWIWSHKWSLYSIPGGQYTTADNNSLGTKVKVYDYHTEPALSGSSGTAITTIGVICHETGHFFGLPDLYDTDGTSQGIGSYCLMANSWGFDNTGQHPPLFSAWCKVQLGWVTPTLVSGGTISAPRVMDNKSIFRVNTGYPSGEYLLIENRQPVGFESTLPQGGLAIWHIDENKPNNSSEGFPGQVGGWPTNNNHYKVALLQADGLYELEKNVNRGNAGDVYRNGGVSSITPATTPNTQRYQGGTVAPSNTSITAISNSASTMTFTLSNSVYPAITSAITASAAQGTPFSYQIVASNSPTSYGATGLPSGLGLNTSTGLISGTPSGSGTSNVTLSATNASGTCYATLTLTVTSSGPQPNLAPATPVGWSDKIVISKGTGTNTDSTGLLPSDSLYMDFAVINDGTAAGSTQFSTEIYVDNVLRTTIQNTPPLNTGNYFYNQDYALGTLSVGTHTIRVKVDSSNAVAESNEGDNEYTKTITVGPLTLFDSFTGANLTYTNSPPSRSFIGIPMTFAAGGGTSNVNVTGGTVYLLSTAAVSYTNIRLNITFWGTASGATSGSTPAYSNSLGTYSFDLGAVSAGAGNYYPVSFTLPSTVVFPTQTGGITVNWQGNTGAGLVSTDNLTSLLRYGSGLAAGSLTLGTAGTNGFYQNASNETDGNFVGSSFRTFGVSYANEGLALQLIGSPGDSTPPTLTTRTIASNNANTARAKVGDVITLSLTASEAINTPTVTLAGRSASVSGSDTNWTASITVTGSDTEGATAMNVTYSDLSGNAGTAATTTTNASFVTIDRTAPTIAISAPSTSVTNTGPVTYTVTYSDTNFNASTLATGDITLIKTGTANGTLAVSGSGTTRTVTINPTTGTGTLAISVAAGTASDTSGNSAPAAGASTTFSVDNTAPTLTTRTIASNNSNTSFAKVGNIITLSLAASESISAPTVTMAGRSASVSGSGTTWLASITVSGTDTEGSTAINVTYSDLMGNAGTPATTTTNSSSVTIDRTAPAVAISTPSASATNTGPVTYIVTYTDTNFNSSTLVTANVTLVKTTSANGTVAVTGSGATRTVTVSSITGNGTLGITIPSGTASDAAGNTAPAPAASTTFIVDNTAPTMGTRTIVSNNANTARAKVGNVITLSLIASEAINQPTVTLAGRSASVTGSGTTWSATIAVLGTDTEGTTALNVTYSDLAGNAGTAATTTSNSSSVTIDRTAPTIAISAPSASLTKAGPVTYTVTYSDINFNASTLVTGDITLNTTGTANGTMAVTGSGTTRTVTISSTTGTGTLGISIAAGTASDTAGNTAPSAGPSTTFSVDNTAPTVVVSSVSATSSSQVINFTLTFSESVTGLTVAGITVTNGTKGTLTGSGTTYTLPVMATVTGNVTCKVNAAAASDAATNTNTASNTATVQWLTAQESWRQQYFGIITNTGNAADNADPDGDGNNNKLEYIAGLIPNDPNSRFNISAQPVIGQPGQRKIVFSPIVAGRTYVVKSSTTLTNGSWIDLTDPTTSNAGNVRTVTDVNASQSKKFYHVEITLP